MNAVAPDDGVVVDVVFEGGVLYLATSGPAFMRLRGCPSGWSLIDGEQLPCARYAFQLDAAAVREADPRACDQIFDRARDEDLPGPGA